MTGWLGRDKDVYLSLSDAYKNMYKETVEEAEELTEGDYGAAGRARAERDSGVSFGSGGKEPMSKKSQKMVDDYVAKKKAQKEEYEVSDEDAIALEEGKKKCKEGYKYDSDKKKCVKKKKKSSSSSKKTVVVVKNRGGGGYYGPGYIHGGGGSNGGGSDGGDGGDTDGGGDGGGGE